MTQTLTRRDALAGLSTAAAWSLLRGPAAALGAGLAPGVLRGAAAPLSAADTAALAVLDDIAEHYLRFAPEGATSLGVDTGVRTALRAQLADRSAAGQGAIAEQLRRDLRRAEARRLAVCTVHHAVWEPLGFAVGFASLVDAGALVPVVEADIGCYVNSSNDGCLLVYRVTDYRVTD